MQTATFPRSSVSFSRQLADYDFIRDTYEALLRAREPDEAAIDAAFEALDAAHARLKAAHRARQAELAVH